MLLAGGLLLSEPPAAVAGNAAASTAKRKKLVLSEGMLLKIVIFLEKNGQSWAWVDREGTKESGAPLWRRRRSLRKLRMPLLESA